MSDSVIHTHPLGDEVSGLNTGDDRLKSDRSDVGGDNVTDDHCSERVTVRENGEGHGVLGVKENSAEDKDTTKNEEEEEEERMLLEEPSRGVKLGRGVENSETKNHLAEDEIGTVSRAFGDSRDASSDVTEGREESSAPEGTCVGEVKNSNVVVGDETENKICDVNETERNNHDKSVGLPETKDSGDGTKKNKEVMKGVVSAVGMEDKSENGMNSSCPNKEIVTPKDAQSVVEKQLLESDDNISSNSINQNDTDIPETSSGSSTGSAVNKSVEHTSSTCAPTSTDKTLLDKQTCDKEHSDDKKYRIDIVHHKESDNFVCKACDFTNKGHGFEEHLMCHLMVRPYQCLYCKESFINRREISRHVLKVHNGAKMSCALRALKRAKAIIKEVTNLGVLFFMARVPGKVPLEKDPDCKKEVADQERKMKDEDGDNCSEINSKHVDRLPKEVCVNQKDASADKNSCLRLKSTSVSENKSSWEQLKEMVASEHKTRKRDNEDDKKEENVGVEDDKTTVNPETLDTSIPANAFSKLRQVLTSSKTPDLVKEVEEKDGSFKNKSFSLVENSKPGTAKPVENYSGIKILASYSLNEEHRCDNADKEPKEVNKNMEPNFIIASPSSSPENGPETLSFLGPERPIFKADCPSFTQTIIPPSSLPPPTSTNPPLTTLTSIKPKQIKTSDFFICAFDCTFTCINKSLFLQHLKDIHSSRPDFPCYYCGYWDISEESLVNHVAYHADSHDKTKPIYSCAHDQCTFISNMLTDFINHTKTTHDENNSPTCKSCGVIFPDVTSFQTHLEDNIIHIVNCPHCPSKATDRRALLIHISSEHPGKPKMVSVAKQLICNARRENGYWTSRNTNEMPPPTLTPGSGFSSSIVDNILRRTTNGGGSTDALASVDSKRAGDVTPDSGHSPRSESSGISGVRVKEELEDEESMDTVETENDSSSYIIDENGVRRRIYVPMSERQAENFRCNFCTFVARDVKRLACHERSHGMPPTRKDRFKCMFCPQGFDSELKFRLHITCHPGLIKFLLYKCKKCEFNSNQKHTIVKHITCNRDKKHRGYGPVENQYTIISRSLESRVLECEQCNYMTRHKIHMAIHYQREHGILRDKSDFRIEGLTPTDTPFSGHDSTQMPDSLIPETSSYDDDFYKRPTYKKTRRNDTSEVGSMSVDEINERNELFTRLVSQQSALQPGHVLENQARKFKCPICKYLLPKAADLKSHVKRHSEVGQITLVMFRCKYCSCMSTARELLYEHLGDKHAGKPIALVKKTVLIDTTEVDRSFAETAVEENLQTLEESVHNEIMSTINSNVLSSKTSSISNKSPQRSTPSPSMTTSFEQLFVIPEGGETFAAALHCPKCSFSSHNRQEIIYHVTSAHPEIKVISSDEDVQKLAQATTKDLHRSKGGDSSFQETKLDAFNNKTATSTSNINIEEVLIVPDDQVFKEAALCSRCNFSTILRKDMVSHLQQNHPEISVMGRNSYPIQASAMGSKIGIPPSDDSCVVGSGNLDNKLRCLYENYGSQMKCLICGVNRPKKFFIHVHILRHLNIFLWKCSFCPHRGLQKYKMVDHIKKIHPGKPMSVRYLPVNVESRVSQFLSQFNVLQNAGQSQEGDARDDEEDYGLGGATGEFEEDYNDDTNDTDTVISIQASSGSTYALGSDALDEKIACLYEFALSQTYNCLACRNQFQRKFAIHRHIIISHLKVALLSCGYCGMQGVEKHQMVDHSLACHPSNPVSFNNNSVDLDKAVSAFLADSCNMEKRSGLLSETEKSELIGLMKSWNASNKNLYRGFNPEGVKIKRPYTKRQPQGQSSKKPVGNKSKTVVDPGVIMLGREALDKELNCLYQSRGGGQFRCLICRWEFPRKYPLHRHIMLKHLRMNLVACPYCHYEGVEKYTVSAHIKEEHKDQPVTIKYVQPDVGARVRHFVEDMASGISTSQDLIRRPDTAPSTSTLSALVKMKREKSFDDFGDNDDEEDDGDDNKQSSSGHGLVVAMFGKKKKKSGDDNDDDDIVVKTEVEDEEFAEGSKLEDDNIDDNVNVFFGPETSEGKNNDTNEEEGEEEEEEEGDGKTGGENFIEEGLEDGFDDEVEDDKDARMRAIREKFLKSKTYGTVKRPLQAYAPGSYRSPNGGKPKALDVITKIKVLKAREGPITKFCCEKCTFSSVHRSNVVRHIYKIHEKYQTHVCPICNYQTLSLILMQTHMGKSHPGVEYTEESFALNPPRSKPRSKPLMGPLSFQRRRQKPKYPPYPTSPPITSNLPPVLSGTGPNETHTGPKQYACAYCHYETNTQADILAHTRDKHTDANVGTGSSVNDTNLNENSEIPNPTSDSNACWEKSKQAVKRKVSDNFASGMIRSKRKFVFEKGEDLIQCAYCEVRETSMGRMQHHFEWEHPGYDLKSKRIPAWRFVCKTCSVKTMATSKMKYHLNRHVSYRPYTCVNCGAFFPSPDQCRRHARSSGHEEQYVYIHNTKKEQRVEELLQATRQLALKIQEDAALDPDFDIGQIDSFLARYQDVKHNLKRVGAGSSPRSKKAKVVGDDGDKSGAAPKRPPAKSVQTLGVEMDVTIQCYICKYESNTIHQVFQHHEACHAGEKFLWTELERGFTCDRSGEAILDSSSFPSTSEEVGYSTKMTLGVGSKTMRFKCKNCDFSSCVIQAMKSHLKSHQPKGFICPYCSRSFSGKEKLMRHQYCLHKGMATWVVHLRKASATTLANTVLPVAVEPSAKHGGEITPDPASDGSSRVSFVCNKCPFTSDNIIKYRRHLAQDHKEFRRNLKTAEGVKTEDSVVSIKTEIENNDDNKDEEGGECDGKVVEDDKQTDRFKCGRCDFSAPDKIAVEEHVGVDHPDDEVIIVGLKQGESHDGSGGDGNAGSADGSDSNSSRSGAKRKRTDLILDLEPKVKMRRISTSTLAAYNEDESRVMNYDDDDVEDNDEDKEGVRDDGDDHVEEAGENGQDEMHSEMFSDDTFHEAELEHDEDELDEEEEEEEEDEDRENKRLSFSHDDVSEVDDSSNNTHFDYKKEKEDQRSLKFRMKFPGVRKSDLSGDESCGEGEDLLSKIGEHDGVDDDGEKEDGDDYHEGVSSPIAEDSEELARQLGLVENQTATNSAMLGTDDSDMMIMEFNGMKSRGGSSRNSPDLVKDERGDNLKDVEDEDEFDYEDEEEEVNMTLASPLPMISLGDGMEMSPGLMQTEDASIDDESHMDGEEDGFSPQTLLDV